MKWRKRNKKKSENTATSADPMTLLDAGLKDADDFDAAEMASIDKELDQALLPATVQALGTIVAPPTDLQVRLSRRVDKKLLTRQTAMMCFDLLTTGWHTTRVVMSPEDDQ